jgi:NAD-dependent deacetylase
VSTDQQVVAIARLVRSAAHAIALTGAGMSTPSGIPDFRTPGSGLWEQTDPMSVASIWGFLAHPDDFYRWVQPLTRLIQLAKPNPAHCALAELEALGWIRAVITQNIDNLHQESGIAPADVVELHGNTTYAVCLGCAARYELPWVRQKFEAAAGRAPDCDCGGHIKTATVSFGQAMPEAAMARAETLTLGCDLFLAIGSSLVVWPAAGFPMLAKRNGARLAIINREPTEFDDMADLVIHDDIGTVLAPFVTGRA